MTTSYNVHSILLKGFVKPPQGFLVFSVTKNLLKLFCHQSKNPNVSSPSKLLISCMMFSVTSVVECLTFVQLWRKVTDRCSLWSWQVFSFFRCRQFLALYRQDIMNRCRSAQTAQTKKRFRFSLSKVI